MILYVIVLFSVRNCWNCECLCSHSTSRKPVEDVEASTSLHPQQNSRSLAWVVFFCKAMDTQNSKPWPSWYPRKVKKHVPALIGCTRFLTRRRDGPGWWFGLFGISFGEKILNLQSVLEGPGAEAFLLSNPLKTTKNNQRHLNLQMPEDKLPDLSFFGGLARTRFHRMSNPFKFKFSFRGSVYAEDTYADADDTEGTPNRPASLRKETDASRHA